MSNYERVCDEQKPYGIDGDQFKLEFFDFSLRWKAKKWFRSLPLDKKDSWTNCKDTFMLEFHYPEINVDSYNIMEVINYLQKMAKGPHTSSLNIAFTEHITNALTKAREKNLD